jgi:transposase
MPTPRSKRGSRLRALARREIINTLVSLTRSGCPGAMLPHDLRPNSCGDDYVAPWRDDGPWTKIPAVWRARVRREA